MPFLVFATNQKGRLGWDAEGERRERISPAHRQWPVTRARYPWPTRRALPTHLLYAMQYGGIKKNFSNGKIFYALPPKIAENRLESLTMSQKWPKRKIYEWALFSQIFPQNRSNIKGGRRVSKKLRTKILSFPRKYCHTC